MLEETAMVPAMPYGGGGGSGGVGDSTSAMVYLRSGRAGNGGGGGSDDAGGNTVRSQAKPKPTGWGWWLHNCRLAQRNRLDYRH